MTDPVFARLEYPLFDAVFTLFRRDGTRCRQTASAADRAVLVELRRFLAVIRGFGSLRYQRADEDQLRKALDDRRRACS